MISSQIEQSSGTLRFFLIVDYLCFFLNPYGFVAVTKFEDFH